MPKMDMTIEQIESMINKMMETNQNMKMILAQNNKVLEKARQGIQYLKVKGLQKKENGN